jgi:hypothetical protein
MMALGVKIAAAMRTVELWVWNFCCTFRQHSCISACPPRIGCLQQQDPIRKIMITTNK